MPNQIELQGIEAVHMIRKGQARWGKGDSPAQLQFIDEMFELAI